MYIPFAVYICLYTAEKDSHSLLDYWLSASFPCSRVIHCMVAAWSLGRRFLYVVNNILEYSFDSSKGAYGGWKPIFDTTNVKPTTLFLLCRYDMSVCQRRDILFIHLYLSCSLCLDYHLCTCAYVLVFNYCYCSGHQFPIFLHELHVSASLNSWQAVHSA